MTLGSDGYHLQKVCGNCGWKVNGTQSTKFPGALERLKGWPRFPDQNVPKEYVFHSFKPTSDFGFAAVYR